MPHTTSSSGTISGSGTWTPTIQGEWLMVNVTNRGTARVMDPNSPPRLFQAGWVALGDQSPETGNPPGFHDVIFVDFDIKWISLGQLAFPSASPLSLDFVRYELMPGVQLELFVYHFY